MIIEDKTPILVPYGDHTYRVVTISKSKAVFNTRYYAWSEYAGEDYLGDGDEVVEVYIVE